MFSPSVLIPFKLGAFSFWSSRPLRELRPSVFLVKIERSCGGMIRFFLIISLLRENGSRIVGSGPSSLTNTLLTSHRGLFLWCGGKAWSYNDVANTRTPNPFGFVLGYG